VTEINTSNESIERNHRKEELSCSGKYLQYGMSAISPRKIKQKPQKCYLGYVLKLQLTIIKIGKESQSSEMTKFLDSAFTKHPSERQEQKICKIAVILQFLIPFLV
jgi:hypothetical protein